MFDLSLRSDGCLDKDALDSGRSEAEPKHPEGFTDDNLLDVWWSKRDEKNARAQDASTQSDRLFRSVT